MIRSMTAFANRKGGRQGVDWDWELRGVNGRGLDLRLRLPEGIEGLEAGVRAALQARLARGSVALNLRLSRTGAAEGGFGIDESQLDRVLHALEQVQQRAFALGVTLGQPTAADVLAQKGVVTAAPATDEEGLLAALLADLDGLLDDFVAAREGEGAALAGILENQIASIDSLVAESQRVADARRDESRVSLRAALRRVVDDVPEVDEVRLAQEVALLAVKSDVTEELDRLRAHIAQARDLIADPKPAGRRFDFLAQEFNREANTLLSKAGSTALSRIGLDLKAAIDQMREQVQNVE